MNQNSGVSLGDLFGHFIHAHYQQTDFECLDNANWIFVSINLNAYIDQQIE